jgi:hypothetical protein
VAGEKTRGCFRLEPLNYSRFGGDLRSLISIAPGRRYELSDFVLTLWWTVGLPEGRTTIYGAARATLMCRWWYFDTTGMIFLIILLYGQILCFLQLSSIFNILSFS